MNYPKKQKREQISTPVGLIEIGGLSKSPFPASKTKLSQFAHIFM